MSERSLILANSYRVAHFREAFSPDFRTANVPLDLFNVFTDGRDTPSFVGWRKKTSIQVEASELHPPFTIDIKKIRRQWWCAQIAEPMTEPGPPAAAAALIMYYQKHGYNVMKFGSRVRVTDLRLDALDESDWPFPLRAHDPERPVLADLNRGRGYLSSIYQKDEAAPDLPTALHNLALDYSTVYQEDGPLEVARMMGAQSLGAFEQVWANAAKQQTAVMAARALLHSGVFAPSSGS